MSERAFHNVLGGVATGSMLEYRVDSMVELVGHLPDAELLPGSKGAGREACAAFRGIHEFPRRNERSEEHTSELQSLMRISYAVFCLKKKKKTKIHRRHI